MSYLDRSERRFDRFSFAAVAAMVGSFLYLAFGPSFDSGYATVGALLVFPFALGALVTQAGGYFSWAGCLGTPIALLCAAMALVYAGAEGFVCLAMVMPIWIVAALGGGLASYWLKLNVTTEAEEERHERTVRLKSAGLALLPFVLIFAEKVSPPKWQIYQVERSITVSKSPGEVWPLLLSIPKIGREEGKPTFTHDMLGVPRPSDATLVRRDGELVRLGSWGDDMRFEEQVDEIQPGRVLSWRFAFPDDSVSKYTDRHISPDGPILKIERGTYRLTKLNSGQTRITLTTRYATRTRLDWYLGWWGEKLLGDIHENVLEIIALRAG